MRLLTTEQYYAALEQAIPHAKKRIVIQAMVILWGGRTEAIARLLEEALKRGVEVRLVGDVFSQYEARTAKIAKRGPGLSWKNTRRVNKELVAAGAHVTYVGRFGLNIFSGRCHSKISIVDDTSYTFGGVNFTNVHLDFHDVMLEIKQKALADRLYELVKAIKTDQPRLPDTREAIDDSNTLLFDGGTPGQSVIYDTACDMLASAKKVWYVSKMCPSGRLAELLKRTDYHAYFNRPELEGPPENLAIRFDQRRWHITNSYTGRKHMHAKIILTEAVDGRRQLITGSNNFARRGITFGTKEIAVHSTDRKLWQSLYDFMHQEIMT